MKIPTKISILKNSDLSLEILMGMMGIKAVNEEGKTCFEKLTAQLSERVTSDRLYIDATRYRLHHTSNHNPNEDFICQSNYLAYLKTYLERYLQNAHNNSTERLVQSFNQIYNIMQNEIQIFNKISEQYSSKIFYLLNDEKSAFVARAQPLQQIELSRLIITENALGMLLGDIKDLRKPSKDYSLELIAYDSQIQ